MTDNEIIKALDCCFRWELTKDCRGCTYENSLGICRENLFFDTLDLINRQKAEIERLEALVDEMSDYFPTCIGCEGKTTLGERTDKCLYLVDDTEYCAKRGISNIANIMKENEALKTEIELLRKAKAEDVSRAYKIAKTEAIKEFAERLKEESIWVDLVSFIKIDNLVKEMTEGGVDNA